VTNRFLKRAYELKEEIVKDRRTIHAFGGVGFDIPETSDYVFARLKELGLEPSKMCKTGIVCTIGSGNKTFMLRADMDALPFTEETGLPFACQNGTHHACGHDMHTAMLLCAARMLTEEERAGRLAGTVKLMFQPAEEILAGCNAMIEAGVLENPRVDAAMSIHITVGHDEAKSGLIRYNRGSAWGSCDTVRITVTGQGGHGAYPFRCIDPINIACRIVTGLQELTSSEVAPTLSPVVTICRIASGTAANVIPNEAVLEGTIRSLDPQARALLKSRVKEIATHTSATYRGSAKVEFLNEIAPCISNDEMLDTFMPVLEGLAGQNGVREAKPITGSEDFAGVMERVPSVLFWLGAGSPDEGYSFGIHRPQMTTNEDVLPIGAAMHASCAAHWLEKAR